MVVGSVSSNARTSPSGSQTDSSRTGSRLSLLVDTTEVQQQLATLPFWSPKGLRGSRNTKGPPADQSSLASQLDASALAVARCRLPGDRPADIPRPSSRQAAAASSSQLSAVQQAQQAQQPDPDPSRLQTNWRASVGVMQRLHGQYI
ncbi:hypothetical protein WJX72_003668 [[Myrmecia] bisecta]|uniref:Uncharacterized protein n=1 Tax=[Myrmecia] bisecta TaxID=41462 RepID=A0AAW1R6M9_9CHLO